MPFSQAKSASQSAMQPCRESSGETKPHAAISQAPIPGFSQEQSASICGLMTAIQFAMDQSFDQHFGPVQHSPPTPPPTQPISLAKKKRNQRTRNQYKKKAKAQAQRAMVQVQEVEHLDVQISVEKASKHVVLQLMGAWNVATSWHAAAIQWDALIGGVIMVQNGAIWRPRMGVG